MTARRLLPLLLAVALAAPARAYEVAECDGDATLGNAAILLGWAPPTLGSIGSIVIDDQGAANSSLASTAVIQLWQESRADWAGTSNTSLVIPVPSTDTVDSAELEASLAANDGTRIWMVVGPGTQKAGPPVEQGWSQITGTDPASFLGLTFTVFNTSSRRQLDADILINDDAPGGDPRFYDRNDPPPVLLGSGLFDLRGIMTHEIGHFLGSDHSSQPGALMRANAVPEQDLDLNEDDRNLVRFLYRGAGSAPPDPDSADLAATSCSSGSSPPPPAPSSGGGGGGGCAAGGTSPPWGAGVLLALFGMAAAVRLR